MAALKNLQSHKESAALCAFWPPSEVGQMSPNPSILIGQEVLDGPILAVGHHNVGGPPGMLTVRLQQGNQQMGFIDIPGGHLGGGDHFAIGIHRTMRLIIELGFPLPDYRGGLDRSWRQSDC